MTLSIVLALDHSLAGGTNYLSDHRCEPSSYPLTTEDYGPRALGLARIILDGLGRTTITWVVIFIMNIPGMKWTTVPEDVGIGMAHPGYLNQTTHVVPSPQRSWQINVISNL
jgi:hypothetical protein